MRRRPAVVLLPLVLAACPGPLGPDEDDFQAIDLEGAIAGTRTTEIDFPATPTQPGSLKCTYTSSVTGTADTELSGENTARHLRLESTLRLALREVQVGSTVMTGGGWPGASCSALPGVPGGWFIRIVGIPDTIPNRWIVSGSASQNEHSATFSGALVGQALSGTLVLSDRLQSGSSTRTSSFVTQVTLVKKLPPASR